MTQFVIRIIGASGYAPAPPDEGPWYVLTYDPEYKGGLGEVVTTADKTKALRFPSNKTAWDCWRQSPKAKPLREDGKPNRPLTAFTIMVEPLREEASND